MGGVFWQKPGIFVPPPITNPFFKPTTLTTGSTSLSTGLVQLGFDTGGAYSNLIAGAPFNVNSLNGTSFTNLGNGMFTAALSTPAQSTIWGNCTYWQGQPFDFTQRGWMTDVDDPSGVTDTNIIQTTTFLAGKAAGVGLTFFCVVIPIGANTEDSNNSLCCVYGRPFVPDNQTYNWGIVCDPTCLQYSAYTLTGSSSGGISGWGAPTSTQIGTTYTASGYNQILRIVVTIQNDSQIDSSNSSATAKFYVNGALIGSTSGLNIPSTGFTYPANLQSAETQIMHGLLYHVASVNSAFPCLNALMPLGGFAGRAWTSTEVSQFSASPYVF